MIQPDLVAIVDENLAFSVL